MYCGIRYCSRSLHMTDDVLLIIQINFCCNVGVSSRGNTPLLEWENEWAYSDIYFYFRKVEVFRSKAVEQ